MNYFMVFTNIYNILIKNNISAKLFVFIIIKIDNEYIIVYTIKIFYMYIMLIIYENPIIFKIIFSDDYLYIINIDFFQS